MKCASCGADNREGRRFCGACGKTLSRECPQCRFENDPDDRFCGGCGADLQPQTPEPAGDAAAPEEGAADRRQITVLFCDIVGSTALSQRIDPEQLRDITKRYQQACTGVIQRYDGYVARYMGDGVLAYFGYPRAHENDAERAVRAGLDLVAAMNSLNHGTAEAGSRIAVRVGIATGLVVAGDIVGDGEAREQTVVGETPNLAAKLQGAADPDTVVISRSTRALIGGGFECEPLPPVTIKGVEGAVAAFRAIGPSRRGSRFEAARAGTLVPFVGREQEVTLLLHRWQRARQGEGQVILVCGEAGIGKSRIVGALPSGPSHGDPERLLYQCSPYHISSALHPVTEQLSVAAGFERQDGDAVRIEKLEALFARSSGDPSHAAALIAPLMSIDTGGRYPPLGLTPKQNIGRALDALVAHVEGLAKEKPVIVVVEDLHWIDPTSLDFVDRLIAAVGGLRVLVVLTFRPDFQAPWVGEPHVTLISLSRLRTSECMQLVSGVTRGRPLPDDIMKTIVDRADGVPLFIEELTRAILESGVLTQQGDRWVLNGPLPPLAIPSTLKDSLRARLDQLSPIREICQAASVIGRDFSAELLIAVLGRPADQILAALEQLVAAALAIRHGSGHGARYSFKHALIRDAAYESLLKGRRQLLHAKLVAVLRQSYPDTVEAEPALVAEHLTNAGAFAEAADAWLKAGRMAVARAATREAVVHFERCLGALGEAPDDAGRSSRRVEALTELAGVLRIVERFQEALDRLDEAEREARKSDDALVLARIFYNRGNIHFPLGNIDECLSAHQTSFDYAAKVHSLKEEAQALGGLGDAYYQRGRMRTAFDHFSRCVDISTRQGFAQIASANQPMVGWTRLYQNTLAAAIEDGLEAIALAKRAGNDRARYFGHALVGHLCLDTGELDQAILHSREGVGLARKLGTSMLEGQNLSTLAIVEMRTGNVLAARDLIRQALEVTGENTMGFLGPYLLGVFAACTPDEAERRRALARAEELLSAKCVSHNHLWFRREAMEQCLEREEWAEAERHAEALERYTEAEPLPWSDFHCLWARSLIAAARPTRDGTVAASLASLRDEAAAAGLRTALPKIEAALARLAAG